MKKYYILSLISGVLFFVSWPTYGFPFLLFFAFFPLFILEEKILKSEFKRKNLKVFIFSFISFLIWNLFSTWWIYFSSIGGVIMATLLNSLSMSFVFASYSFIKKRKGYS